MWKLFKISLLLSSSLLLFSCEEEDPIADEEITIDSCTLEPSYLSTEGWQEVYIDLPNQTLMSFPNTYTTWLGPTFDTWAFNADREDNEVSFCVEQGWGTDSPEILNEPITLPYKNSDGLIMIRSAYDTSMTAGVLFFDCNNTEEPYLYGCFQPTNDMKFKAGTFFLKKNSTFHEVLHLNAAFGNWDQAVTILSTARVE